MSVFATLTINITVLVDGLGLRLGIVHPKMKIHSLSTHPYAEGGGGGGGGASSDVIKPQKNINMPPYSSCGVIQVCTSPDIYIQLKTASLK